MPKFDIVKSKIKQNTSVLNVVATSDLVETWRRSTGKDVVQLLGQGARVGANYVSAVLDSATAAILMKDLGLNGGVAFKIVNGKQYVIFKGIPGSRSIFSGTRYLARNPKVVDMAIGRMGVNGAILSGARLTIYLVVPLNVINYILSDRQTLAQLIGSTATDMMKLGVAAAVASLAAAGVATVSTLAAGPLVAAIAVGIATSMALDSLDRRFGVTVALERALSKAYDGTVGKTVRSINRVEGRLNWEIMKAVRVSPGGFF